MAEEILGLSANGYSVVQLLATSSGAEMLHFRLGGTVVGWVPWVVKVVCAAESAAEGLSQLGGSLAHEWDRRGGTAEPDDSGSQRAHPAAS